MDGQNDSHTTLYLFAQNYFKNFLINDLNRLKLNLCVYVFMEHSHNHAQNAIDMDMDMSKL